MSTITEHVAAFLNDRGITYSTQFVPQSMSRNSEEKNRSLNWRVTLRGKTGHLTTDYMQGIAHIPNYQHNDKRTVDHAEREELAAEKGRYALSKASIFPQRALPSPSVADVLYSLVQDSSALDSGSFPDWASELGYDPDSRKAERTYNQCIEIGRTLRDLFGHAGFATLREMFADY